ncbi:hypothetical protein D3C74_98230 [compost metagenome]
MYLIYNSSQLETLCEDINFTSNFTKHIKQEFLYLRDLNDHDNEGKLFDLSNHGYTIVVLEPNEPLEELHKLGICLLTNGHDSIEYTMATQVDGLTIFKICLMLDNEHFTMVYSECDSQLPIVEEWLAKKAEVSRL